MAVNWQAIILIYNNNAQYTPKECDFTIGPPGLSALPTVIQAGGQEGSQLLEMMTTMMMTRITAMKTLHSSTVIRDPQARH